MEGSGYGTLCRSFSIACILVMVQAGRLLMCWRTSFLKNYSRNMDECHRLVVIKTRHCRLLGTGMIMVELEQVTLLWEWHQLSDWPVLSGTHQCHPQQVTTTYSWFSFLNVGQGSFLLLIVVTDTLSVFRAVEYRTYKKYVSFAFHEPHIPYYTCVSDIHLATIINILEFLS